MSRTYSGSSVLEEGVRTVLKPQPGYMSKRMEDANKAGNSVFIAVKTQLKPMKPQT